VTITAAVISVIAAPKEEAMKKSYGHIAAAAALLAFQGLAVSGRAAEVIKTDDLTLDIGGRFQTLGELENVTTEHTRENTRVYLFNTEDRLKASGLIDGTKFYFEESLGGEADNSSNNQTNLLEYNAEVPLIWGTSVVVGQFRVPTSHASAGYEENMVFTEHSPLTDLFFNQGYDTGIVLKGSAGLFDALVGTISGAPDLPQRYLPEIFNVPPLMIARVGLGNIKDDAFHPAQEGFAKPDTTQWAVHANGQYINDSNAGHSTDLSLQSSYFTTFSANSEFGNAVLNSSWNPYLGKTAANFGAVTASYWTASIDAQLRQPLGDYTLVAEGQGTWTQFQASNFAPVVMNGRAVTSGSLNVSGAELMASLQAKMWALSARASVVLPDSSFSYNYAGTNYTPITGSAPIWEVTFPSLMVKVNSRVKLVAEGLFLIDTPEALGNDGVYEVTEMPSQVTNATAANPITRNEFVSIGRMMFQFAF
jgi:hypothetical protein